VGHEFDGEDVARVAGIDLGGKVELIGCVVWQVAVDIDNSVVGPRSEQST
jgi:glycerate kinase